MYVCQKIHGKDLVLNRLGKFIIYFHEVIYSGIY
jgi:hypothetical protein